MSFGIIAAVTTVVSTGVSLLEADKAKRAGKKGNKLQKEITALKNKQAKRDFFKNSRVEEANAITSSLASGGDFESSRSQGQQSTIKTQTALGLKEHEKLGALGAEVGKQQQKQADAQFNSGVASSVAGFANQFASFKKAPPTETVAPAVKPKTDFQGRVINYGN